MNRDAALRKILACLRMGASSNAHEAAAALRQARALMHKYGLAEEEALASGIKSERAKTRSRGGELPRSIMALAHVVAGGYRCHIVIHRGWNDTGIVFYGTATDCTVASYAFTVLRRQLEAAQAKHTARIRKKANKEVRREAFAMGYVAAVADLFPREEIPEDHALAIRSAVQLACPNLGMAEGRPMPKSGRVGFDDQAAGYVAGKDARLHTGVGGAGQARLGVG